MEDKTDLEEPRTGPSAFPGSIRLFNSRLDAYVDYLNTCIEPGLIMRTPGQLRSGGEQTEVEQVLPALRQDLSCVMYLGGRPS